MTEIIPRRKSAHVQSPPTRAVTHKLPTRHRVCNTQASGNNEYPQPQALTRAVRFRGCGDRTTCNPRGTVDLVAINQAGIELVYGGVFRIDGFPQEHMLPVLFIECPRLLFPFARQIVAEATRQGGFPPLMIDPIDFAHMFQQRMAQEQAKAKSGQGGPQVQTS